MYYFDGDDAAPATDAPMGDEAAPATDAPMGDDAATEAPAEGDNA